jgi:hypothetical protein
MSDERLCSTREQQQRAVWILYFRETFKLPRLLTDKEASATFSVRRNTPDVGDNELVDSLFAELNVAKVVTDSGIPTKYDRVCFACGKQMKTAFGESDAFDPHEIPLLSPNDGIYFKSLGNYGSTVYDPLNDHEYLHIIVCDECLKKNADRICVVKHGANYHVNSVENFSQAKDEQ